MAAGDVTIIAEEVFGTRNVVIATVEGPASYAAGGFALTTAKFGLATVDFVHFELIEQDADEAFAGRYDRATDKIQVYETISTAGASTDALQEIGAVNLSTVETRVMAVGRK